MALFGSTWNDDHKSYKIPDENVIIIKKELSEMDFALTIAMKKIKLLEIFHLHKLIEKYDNKISLEKDFYGLKDLSMKELENLEGDLGIPFMFSVNKQI